MVQAEKSCERKNGKGIVSPSVDLSTPSLAKFLFARHLSFTAKPECWNSVINLLQSTVGLPCWEAP